MLIYAKDGTPLHISDEDAHLFEGLSIFPQKGNGYKAYSRLTRRPEALGRLILGLEPGDKRYVRTRDGDQTDYRRENLIVVNREKSYSLRDRTRSEEAKRKAWERLEREPIYSRPKTTSKYRGVTMYHPNGDTEKQVWKMRITVHGQAHRADYPTEEAAARAYDAVRLKHGLGAINFPDSNVLI